MDSMDRILTETDCYIYMVDIQGYPPTEAELLAEKKREEILAAKQREGKILIKIAHNASTEIIKGALKIGLTKYELSIFLRKFNEAREYFDLHGSKYYNKNTEYMDITSLLDEIFEIGTSFTNSELGEYFIQSAYKEMQGIAHDFGEGAIFMFNKKFAERRTDANTPKVYPLKEIPKALKKAIETFQPFTDSVNAAMKKFREELGGPDEQTQNEKQKEAKEPTEKKEQTLPSIQDAIKSYVTLSEIWKKCASMERLVFDKDGNFIWEGKREHAVLYAFSAAMKQRNLLSENVSIENFYLILCLKHGVTPASRIDKIPQRKTTYYDFYEVFLEILEEMTDN